MRYAIFILAIGLIFCSCEDKSKKDLEMIKFLNDGLVHSTTVITYSNNSIYLSLKQKLQDFKYYNVEKWQLKAEQIRLISDSVIRYIDEIKDKVQDSTGLNEGKINKLFDEKTEELFNQLIKYRSSIFSIDSSMTIQFIKKLKFFSDDFDFVKNDAKQFRNNFFNKVSALEVMVTLNRFENNVKINENDLASYCLNQVYSGGGYFSSFSAIIGQSVNTVKGGDYIELNGGVGYFSTVAKATMKVNGMTVEANADGVANYKLKSSTKIGKHKVPVTIEYINHQGIKDSKTYYIEYTVQP